MESVRCPVVVGRGAEMEALRFALAEAEAARGGVVVLAGEAGLGKSRLLGELAEVARARGGVALTYIDPAKVHWSSPAYLDNTRPEIVDGLRRLSAAVHAEGAKVFQQLMHGGPTNIPQDGSPPWGAS